MKINEYVELLASNSVAPGGGSASALCGAQGVALFTMVARLTVDKAKYESSWEICRAAIEKGDELQNKLCELIDKDTDAYNLVSDAFKLPKSTDEEKEVRKKSIRDATLIATKVPFETMSLALEGLRVAYTLMGKSNTNAASDLGVAAQNLLSCVKGAWLNVRINLCGIGDESLSSKFNGEGLHIVEEATSLATDIFLSVEASL